MIFNESRLLDRVAYGSNFGHRYKTRITELKNGVERRNAEWSAPLAFSTVIYDNLDPGDHIIVVNAHHACMGSLIGFRFRDWSNYTAENEVIGYGTDALASYQLIKTRTFGALSTETNVVKPVSGTVTIFVDGTPTAATVDYTTGIVQVSAASGAEITWSGEFDTPVRFESDDIDFSIDNKSRNGFVLTANVDVIEIRLP